LTQWFRVRYLYIQGIDDNKTQGDNMEWFYRRVWEAVLMAGNFPVALDKMVLSDRLVEYLHLKCAGCTLEARTWKES